MKPIYSGVQFNPMQDDAVTKAQSFCKDDILISAASKKYN
jgi:hypothetical protein